MDYFASQIEFRNLESKALALSGPKATLSKPQRLWLMTAIVLLAFGLRLYRLDFQSLRGDEAASATYASLSAAEILEISRVADPHPPLFYLVLHGWEWLTGPSEFAVRLWVVWPGVLLLPSLYVLTRRLVGDREAILAAFLLAVNSYHIWHSQDVRSYTWFVLLGVWSALFLWQGLQHGRRWDWVGYTLSMAALFYVHYYAAFLVIFHGLYVLWFSWRRKPRWLEVGLTWGLTIFVAVLIFLPWLSLSWRFISRFTGDFEPALPHIVLWRGLQAFSGGLIAKPVQLAWWTVPLILLAGVGLWAVWRARRSEAVFLCLYLSLPFVGVMALTWRGQAFTERYLMAALPAYVVLVAVGLIWLWREGGKWGWLLVMLGISLAIWGNGGALARYHFDPALAKSPEWRQVFDHLMAHGNPQTDLLIYNFPEAAVTYYLDTNRPRQAEGSAMPIFLVPPSPNPPPQELNRTLTDLLGPYDRVWFVPVENSGWDDGRQVETWLTRHADRLDEAQFHWIRTNLYLTPSMIERTMQSQSATFIGGITLRGFQVFNTISQGQNYVRLGDEALNLSLYWTSDGPTDIPLTVFTQLIDATGFFRGGQDNQPVWGTYPTTAWQPGEKITDKYLLSPQPEAPPGRYQVWVGLYDLQTGERVMVLDEDGNPLADHVVLNLKVIIE